MPSSQPVRRALALSFVGLAATSTVLAAQYRTPSYKDLTIVRNRPWAKQDFLEFRAGALASQPSGKDEARSAEDALGFDGHVYWRKTQAFGRQGHLDVYAGRDGAYVGLTEGDPTRQAGYSRLELFGRQWGHFVREGFYSSDDFIPVGQYRMRDWRARLSFATQFAETLRGEVGGFYGKNTFSRYKRTATSYSIPENYSVYGVSAIIEDNKLQLDPSSSLPAQGFLLSAWIEREWNSSDKVFGITGRETELPSAVVRGGGHLEWYFPYTNSGTWVLEADVGVAPKDDRVWIYDTSKPVGQIWVDGRVSYRILLSDTLSLLPGARAQWVQIADEFNMRREKELFFGAQVELRADFSENLAIALEYSFLTNESREPVLFHDDSIGVHRLFLGIEFRP